MKSLRLSLAVLLLGLGMILLSACTSKESGTKAPEESQSGGSTGEATGKTEELEGYLASKDPMTITMYMHNIYDHFSPDKPVFKKATELTNITLKNEASNVQEADEAFNLMLSGGQIPDLIQSPINSLNEIGLQGALLPLQDLVAEHAPHLQKFLDENPDIRKTITAPDGNIYAISHSTGGDAAHGYFIRQDWLGQLGLETPKNVDELYTVLKSFRENDPNGNGQKDEIPYFARNVHYLKTGLFHLWDAHWDFYVDGDKVEYGPNNPQYKDALVNVSKWYAEGLIDPEIFTRGPQSRDYALGNNIGGMTHDYFASTASYTSKLAGEIEGFQFKPITPPMDINGDIVEPTRRDKIDDWLAAWGISAKAADPIAIMKYIDFWFTEEGLLLFNYGIEGESYNMVDGKPILTDEVLESGSVAEHLTNEYGAHVGVSMMDYDYEIQWTNEDALAGIMEYTENDYFTKTKLPLLPFTVDEKKELDKLLPEISTYVDEATEKWILGSDDVDSTFDNYIQKLGDFGIERVLELYQAAYDRYQEN